MDTPSFAFLIGNGIPETPGLVFLTTFLYRRGLELFRTKINWDFLSGAAKEKSTLFIFWGTRFCWLDKHVESSNALVMRVTECDNAR